MAISVRLRVELISWQLIMVPLEHVHVLGAAESRMDAQILYSFHA